jgi:hypothetical protein
MKKASALKILNPIVAVLFLNQTVTGVLGPSVIDYTLYKVIHGWAGYLFAATVILHFILNWTWVKSTFFKKKVKI